MDVVSTGCPQCDAAARDVALARINHTKETPMTTTPEPLTWTPGDGLEALLAIRDRVRAAQDAELERERMTVTMEGGDWRSIHEAPPRINADGDLICVEPVTVHGGPCYAVSRVEWTPPTEPEPAWADAQAAIAVTSDQWFEIAQTSGEYDDRRGLWFTGGESQGRTVLGQAAEWRRDEATVYPLIRDGRVCAEAILALGVDDHGALYDAWVHNVGRGVWIFRDAGGDDQ